MTDGFSMEVKGLKEVEERMILLGAVAGAKVMRSTLFFASKPILEQTQANLAAIPTGSGALHRATRRVYMRGGTNAAGQVGSRFTVSIAPKAKDAVAKALASLFYHRRVRGVFWGHLVEWGFTTSAGRKIPGKLVFTRALTARAAEAIELFRDRIGRAVERALKRQSIE